MDQEDLHWVKCNMNTWDSPECPLTLPKPQLYDASALILTHTPQGGAARQTATCPACAAICYNKKVIQTQSYQWGRCVREVPPPATSAAVMVEVFEEVPADFAAAEDDGNDEDAVPPVTASRANADAATVEDDPSEQSEWLIYPHAKTAMADGATWVTESSVVATDLPSNAEDLDELVDDVDFDDDELVVQPGFMDPGDLSLADENCDDTDEAACPDNAGWGEV